MNAPLPIEQHYVAAMARHRRTPDETVADGQQYRFDGPGGNRRKRSAWRVLHSEGLAAASRNCSHRPDTLSRRPTDALFYFLGA